MYDAMIGAGSELEVAHPVPGEPEVLAPTRAEIGFIRDRTHRFPGRRNALKVLYDDVELASVRSAADLAGLTPTGFVAAAGLTLSGAGVAPVSSVDRLALAELLQLRNGLRRYAVNLNQAVAALNSGAGAPVWMLHAVAGCARATDRIDELTVLLTQRLG